MSDYISEDLVVEIFTRLPPKSLIRFRSVSKSLCSRIATPDFIRLNTIRCTCRIAEKVLLEHCIAHQMGVHTFYEKFYSLHSEYQLPLSPNHGYDGITPFKFPFPLRSSARAVGSCNGIMCVFLFPRNLILWNPLLKRKLKLPRHPLRNSFIYATGFAFDRVSEDYKIVTISIKHGKDLPYNSFVYTMKTRTWCQISNPFTPSCYEPTEGHLVNGVIHWVVRDPNRYIITFDVGTHVFCTIELPSHAYSSWIVKLTTINNSLAVITYEDTDNATIWVRKESNTPYWVSYLVFKSDILDTFMPLSINGYLLLNYYLNGIEVYGDCTRARSRLVEFSNFSMFDGMSWFVESLELLDTGSPYKESKPSVKKKKEKHSKAKVMS